jgi:hypothetical protein
MPPLAPSNLITLNYLKKAILVLTRRIAGGIMPAGENRATQAQRLGEDRKNGKVDDGAADR